MSIVLLVFCCISLSSVGFESAAYANDHKPSFNLTSEEQIWLDEHRGTVRLAPAPDWEPMEFYTENDEYRGIVADYIRLIERRLNFKFNLIRTQTWSENLTMARNKEIDVITAAKATADRKEYMIWSTPYLTLNTTIIVNKEITKNLTLEEMDGMRIGVPRNYAVTMWLMENYPHLNYTNVEHTKEGLYKVSFGELDAMIAEVPNALYVIESEKITNLRLAGDTGFELQMGVGVRNDWPIFAQIIEKVLSDISEEEHQSIYNKWIHLQTEHFYETRTFWYSIIGVLVFVLASVGTVMVWNQTLQKQVEQRTEAVRFNEMRLEALLKLHEQSEGSIQEIIEFAFHQMIRLTKSRFGYLAFEDQDGIIYSVQSSGDTSEKNPNTKIAKGFSIETQGLWGEAVRRKKSVISNNYSKTNPMKKGLPKEFHNLNRYMNIPIFKGDQVVVVAGVGNKAVDYDNSDLRQITLLVRGLWRRLQRKQVEQTLAENEKNLRDIVENSPNGISLIQNGEVVYRNPQQIRLLGEIKLGKKVKYGHVYYEDQEATRNFYKSILAGNPEQTELSFRFYNSLTNRSKETLKWVTCIVAPTPINYRGSKAFLLTTIDRTRARELEHLLTVQDKMASLGRVAAGIGHEIRNPLSGINIYLRAIEKGVNNPSKAHKIDPAIDAIRTASSKMEGVIKRVIDFAKPIEPKFTQTDMNGPVQEAVQLANMSMEKKKIKLKADLDPNLPPCFAEHNLIEEVVLNLIHNAADALNGQKKEKRIWVTTAMADSKITISVEDTGPGVSVDLADKIFEPFYTTKEYSTGIGLSLCQRIITDHNGTIRVEPGKNGGARFIAAFPMAAQTSSGLQKKEGIQS